MDINLPGMKGVECVRQLKASLPAVQFMMLTVYEDSDSLFNSLKAGASGYLLKRTASAGFWTPSATCMPGDADDAAIGAPCRAILRASIGRRLGGVTPHPW